MYLLSWKVVFNKLLRKKVDFIYYIILNDFEDMFKKFNYFQINDFYFWYFIFYVI